MNEHDFYSTVSSFKISSIQTLKKKFGRLNFILKLLFKSFNCILHNYVKTLWNNSAIYSFNYGNKINIFDIQTKYLLYALNKIVVPISEIFNHMELDLFFFSLKNSN